VDKVNPDEVGGDHQLRHQHHRSEHSTSFDEMDPEADLIEWGILKRVPFDFQTKEQQVRLAMLDGIYGSPVATSSGGGGGGGGGVASEDSEVPKYLPPDYTESEQPVPQPPMPPYTRTAAPLTNRQVSGGKPCPHCASTAPKPATSCGICGHSFVTSL
jgi:hypothetical protein